MSALGRGLGKCHVAGVGRSTRPFLFFTTIFPVSPRPASDRSFISSYVSFLGIYKC